MSKKSKIRKSRHTKKLSRTDLFPKKMMKEDYQTYLLDKFISEAIPNLEEKQRYVQALIDGLENETCMEM